MSQPQEFGLPRAQRPNELGELDQSGLLGILVELAQPAGRLSAIRRGIDAQMR